MLRNVLTALVVVVAAAVPVGAQSRGPEYAVGLAAPLDAPGRHRSVGPLPRCTVQPRAATFPANPHFPAASSSHLSRDYPLAERFFALPETTTLFAPPACSGRAFAPPATGAGSRRGTWAKSSWRTSALLIFHITPSVK
jgi:hypothetical protein